MSKKSLITQNLANGFPEWTRVRTDEQSVGQSFLNVIGQGMEDLVTEFKRGFDNLYLTTVNTDEIDLTYTFKLPNNFNFTQTTPSEAGSQLNTPVVSGLQNSVWYLLSEVSSGRVKDFWYEAIPDRVSTVESFAASGSHIINIDVDNQTIDSISGYTFPNYLTVNVSSGTLLFELDRDEVVRAKVRLTGTSWKGVTEEEELIFLFNQEKRTQKIWESLDTIELVDFPETAHIDIYSQRFNLTNYPDIYNDQHQFSDSRDELSLFWGLDNHPTISGVRVLDRKRYAVNKAVDLLRNRTDIVVERSWELLNTAGSTVNILDIIPQSYIHRAWAIDSSKLYLYSLDWNQPDLKRMTEKTAAPMARIQTSSDYVLRDDDLTVDLMFVRPIQTMIRHRLRIKYPDNQEFGILSNGSLVSTSSNYWVSDLQDERFLRATSIMEFSDLGEHILTLECEYQDGTIEIDQRMILVDFKEPLAEFDLSALGTLVGIDIDHQQRLLVLTSDDIIHYIQPHYDIMLVDYTNRELIFREEYDQVKVIA